MIKPISSLRGAVVVWLVSYVFFLLTLANNFSASHDSINYLNAIVNGTHLFHQHHLLYHYYANTWLHLFSNIFPSVGDHYLIESFTAIWGSANLALCYLFFRNRFQLTTGMAATGVSLIAFSFGTWFYSVNIEVYSPPIFFILFSLYIITKKMPVANDVWKIGILHSLAILFHQLNILFIVVVFYWMYVNRKTIRFSSALVQYAVIGLVLTGGVYLFCGVFYEHKNSVASFTEWILGYTKGHSFWQPLTMKTPINVAAGFSRSFVGGHFIFQHPLLERLLANSFRSHGLKDELFLAANISVWMTWVLSALLIVIVTFLVFMTARFVSHFKVIKLHYHVIRPLVLCIVTYSIFFCFWMPEILEFWILQMILIWLLLFGMLPVYRFPFRISTGTGAAVLVLSLFIVNYFGSIRWLQNINSDWFYVEVKKLDPALTADDVVIVEDEWILKDYVRRYSKAKVIATDEPDFNKNEAGKIVNDAVSSNHKVYLYKNQGNKDSWVPIQSY